MSQPQIEPTPVNVVVLVVDQITAGMLGPYGNTVCETMNFNRLAARSLVFDFAFANSPDLNVAYQAFWKTHDTIQPAGGNLPGFLAAAGFDTVLITDETSLSDHELAEFDRIIAFEQPDVQTSANSAAETQLAIFFAQATSLLTEMEAGSLYWLHSRGLRGAWDAPYFHRTQLADSEDPDPPAFVASPSMWLDPQTVDPDELLGLQTAAAAQVQLLDEFLGVLLDLMDSQPIWQNTLFCLAAPRGCALGEHGLVGAGAQLFNESVQIPLMACLPGLNHSLRAMRSGNLVQANLMSEIIQAWFASDRHQFEERLVSKANVAPDRRTECILISSNEQDSLQTHAWKLIRSKMGGVQLFAKPDDRYEVNNVSDRCPEIVAKLVLLLDHLLETKTASGKLQLELPDDLAFGLN